MTLFAVVAFALLVAAVWLHRFSWPHFLLACEALASSDGPLLPTKSFCAEFWINRYQQTLIGGLATVVGAIAAMLVLVQLGHMSRQNQNAEQVLEIAREELKAGQRRDVGQAIRASATVVGHLFSLRDFLWNREESDFAVPAFYDKWLDRFVPDLKEFRFAMDVIKPPQSAVQNYEDFEVCISAATGFFDKDYHDNLAEILPTYYSQRTVKSIVEAREEILTALKMIHSLQIELREMRKF